MIILKENAIRAIRLHIFEILSSNGIDAVCRCAPYVYTIRNGTERRRSRATEHRIAMRLTPNYVLMKINRYICTSVVSLWAFPRITRTPTLRPRSSSFPLPSLSLCLSFSALSGYLRTPRHLFDSLKGIPVSICLFRFVPSSPSAPRIPSTRLGRNPTIPPPLPNYRASSPPYVPS